jgi:ABC-2 type transport system permease protein
LALADGRFEPRVWTNLVNVEATIRGPKGAPSEESDHAGSCACQSAWADYCCCFGISVFPSLVIGVFEFFLALTACVWGFDVPLGGSLWFLCAATLLYLLSALGVGLFISTFSRTQQQAFMGGFLFLLPANLLSGMLTPVSSMPGWLRPFTLLNPVRYYLEILRAALLKGAGFADLWVQVSALAAFGAIIVAVSAARFKTRLA